MWSYYGSKSKIIKRYPSPLYDTIIEPFAGSARYALRYWNRKVILVEKDFVVTSIWRWLRDCSKDDILSLPQMVVGSKVSDYNFPCIEAVWLMGFLINQGSAVPKKTMQGTFNNGNMEVRVRKDLIRISEDVSKIRSWEIINDSYEKTPNIKATYFIDPPYQNKGMYYRHSCKDINFQKLSDWCKSRKGQIMVCENAGADWLPFKPFLTMQGSIKSSKEVLWQQG